MAIVGTKHPREGTLQEALRASATQRPAYQERHRCSICLQRQQGVTRQCWGCAQWFHPTCLLYDSHPPGPFYCRTCRHLAYEEQTLDYTYDLPLMTYLTTAQIDHTLSASKIARIQRQATWLKWERSKLFITSGPIRKVPPPHRR